MAGTLTAKELTAVVEFQETRIGELERQVTGLHRRMAELEGADGDGIADAARRLAAWGRASWRCWRGRP